MPADPISITRLALFSAIGIPVVIQDLRSRNIPNKSCGILFAAGLALACVQSGLRGAENAVLAALIGFTAFLVLHIAGGMGGGDVKLSAACGSLLGMQDLVTAAVMTAVAGMMHAIWVLARGALTGKREATIPYAPAIAIGTALVLIARLR
jgi:prepilin peptidase CpaA